jgi:hypothetical protein
MLSVASSRRICFKAFILGALLACLGYFYGTSTRAVLTTQDNARKKVVRKIPDPTAPVEITKLKLKGKPINFDRAFDAEDDWIKGLSVDVKNVSDREIVYLKIELNFPADDSEERFYVTYLEHGRQPAEGSDTAAPTIKPIRPGETITLAVPEGVPEAVRRSLRKEGSGNALKLNRIKLYANQAWFDKDTMWMLGTTFVRDPVSKELKPVNQISALPPGARDKTLGGKALFIRAALARTAEPEPAAAIQCYTTRAAEVAADVKCCKPPSTEDRPGTRTTNGNFAVWKQEVCPADCSTKNYWWVGTSPGCTPTATCRPSGDLCNANTDCCNQPLREWDLQV